MKAPVLFLAFANDPTAHLFLLEKEQSLLEAALEEADRKSYIQLHKIAQAGTREIFAACTEYKDRLAIFHYAGHANGERLKLETGEGDARGLATLLGEQANLKLVFLNGCSSKGQVKTLFDAGVKAVIATSVKIADDMAVVFAQQFYESLAHRRTIGQAFSLARAYVQTHFGERAMAIFRDIVINRADMLAKQAGDKEEDIPWGLYVQEEYQEEILNWKLPSYRQISLPVEVIQRIKTDKEANGRLLRVLEEMGRYNPDIYHKMVEQKGEEFEILDSSYFPQLIVSSFPWPIGSQIRLLFVDDCKILGSARLRQLVSTYVITSQVLYLILLSDFWEQIQQQQIPVPTDMDLRLPKDKASYLSFDWLAQIPPLVDRMIQGGGMPFIPEYEAFCAKWKKEGSRLRKAYNLLEMLRSRGNALPTSKVDQICLQIEKALSIVLEEVSFLVRYSMLTVRNISIDMPRCQDLVYEMDLGSLNNKTGNSLSLYKDDEKRRKQTYTNSQSILLVYDEKNLSQSLDLSPFVMDRNTFVNTMQGAVSKDTTAKLFLAAWEADRHLYYLSIDKPLSEALEIHLHQIHTNMTQADFDEGRNADPIPTDEADSTNDADEFLDFDLDDELGEDAPPPVEEESPKVFALLQHQYQTFLADVSIAKPPISHA